MILAITGPNKTAKTSLALSAPKKLRHYDLDLGFDRAAYRFQADIDAGLIMSSRYPTPPQGVSISSGKVTLRPTKRLNGIRELWEQFLSDYLTALMDPEYATHVIDTASQAWETCHRGFLQEKQEAQNPALLLSGKEKLRESLMPIEYGEPNARMRATIYAARTYNRNLVLTHYERPEYQDILTEKGKDSMATGRMEMDGFKHTGGLADIVVYTYLLDNVPWCKVLLCGLDLRLQGMELKEPTWDSIMDVLKMLRGEG